MSFGHERLDVYHKAVEYVAWVYRHCESLHGHRQAKDQLLRASQAIPLNIAEGNGKAADADRRRFFEIARGSVHECAAIQDVLEACGGLSPDDNLKWKEILDRISAMLTRLGGRGYCVRETSVHYGSGLAWGEKFESDKDNDRDSDRDNDRDSDRDNDGDSDRDSDSAK